MNLQTKLNKKINLYELLGIESNSSQYEIKKAWKKLALKYHPDKTMNSSNDEFIKLKYAYDILSDENLKKEYDRELNCENNFEHGLNFFNLNMVDLIKNFIKSTEINKILKLMEEKKILISELFNIYLRQNNFNDFIKKLVDITVIIDFDLKDVWMCNPKKFTLNRTTKNFFEELIYPIDFEQVYENEGDEIIIGDVLYKGNLTIKINVINMKYYGENYYILDNELYVLINNQRIKNNIFQLIFLNGIKYKFDITKLNKINNKIGCVYFKKKFGLAKFLSNDSIENHIDNQNHIESSHITYSNLFFIILL